MGLFAALRHLGEDRLAMASERAVKSVRERGFGEGCYEAIITKDYCIRSLFKGLQ